MKNTRLISALVAVTLSPLGARSIAGPLDPPPGPVASTPRIEPRVAITLDNTPGDVNSLFRITEPGSYYLTGDIVAPGPIRHGIEIASNDVHLDLMGFAIRGASTIADGIASDGVINNITIRNGTITGWNDGIDLVQNDIFASGRNFHFEDLRITGNSNTGLRAPRTARVIRCVAIDNVAGFWLGEEAILIQCEAIANTSHGVTVGRASLIEACVMRSNSGHGVVGGIMTIVRGSIAELNELNGFQLQGASMVVESTSRANTQTGVSIGSDSRVESCIVTLNGGDGIIAQASATIVGSTVSQNTGNGIRVSTDAVVRDNLCVANGAFGGSGAGILLTGSNCRIDSNTCTDNTRGIEATANGSFITRNTCSGNTTNYVIAAGNVCLVVQAATSGAINGSVGGVAPGSTDPNANFSF